LLITKVGEITKIIKKIKKSFF